MLWLFAGLLSQECYILRIRTFTELLLVRGSCRHCSTGSSCRNFTGKITIERSVAFYNCGLLTVHEKSLSLKTQPSDYTLSLLYDSKNHFSKASGKYGKLRLFWHLGKNIVTLSAICFQLFALPCNNPPHDYQSGQHWDVIAYFKWHKQILKSVQQCSPFSVNWELNTENTSSLVYPSSSKAL